MPPYSPGPDLREIEREITRSRRGSSAGQLAFDIAFGILAPIGLLASDLPVLRSGAAQRTVIPPYWAGLTVAVTACLVVALGVWLLTGARRPALGVLLAGPFAAGALLALALGWHLIEFAYSHALALRGLFAFTPWFTAFVLGRQCVRAARAGTEISAAVAAVSLLLGATIPLVTVASIARATDRQARYLEALLFSTDPREQEDAASRIIRTRSVDFDRIALAYGDEPASASQDARRQRIADLYRNCTGESIEAALPRLRPPEAEPPKPKRPEPEAETAEGRTETLIEHLFSEDPKVHEDAVGELTVGKDVDYDPVALRYAKLADADPRKARIAKAYAGLTGETIELALKRLQKKDKAASKEKGPPPEAEAPKKQEPATDP